MNPLGLSNHHPGGGGGGTAVAFDANREFRSRRSPSQPPPPLPVNRWSDQKGCRECDFTGFLIDYETNSATRCSCSSAIK
jgi:hypothetical protein